MAFPTIYRNLTARLIIFDTLADAMASSRVLRAGEFGMVKNDPSSIRVGCGTDLSSETPPAASTAFSYSKSAKLSPAIQAALAGTLNATGTLTAALLLKRYITSTSAAAVTGTLDTAANIGTAIGAVQGTEFDFEIDNSAGASVFTVAVATGITIPGTVVITGSNTLAVAIGAFAKFKLIFKDATHAYLYRTL